MRWKRFAVARTVTGAVISGATVDVYLAGGTTLANVYEAPTGGSAVNRVTSDTDGRYKYYVDAAEYSSAARFKEIITKGSASSTLDNIPIVRWDPTVPQTLAGELTITGLGNGVTFPDGTRMTSTAAPGSGVTALGDISIAADTDANGSGEITLGTQGVARARVPNAGGLEINAGGAWRQVATQDGAETLSNKTLATPIITGFAGTKGHKRGLTPRYKDADELYIGSGVIEIDGTICELETETAFDMDAALNANLGANYWYCFGFKKPSSGATLTSSELICSQGMPTWNEARQGWYLPAPKSGGAAISSGEAGGNYDDNVLNLSWLAYWESALQGSNVNGAAYWGYDAGVGNTIAPTGVFIGQSSITNNAIASAKFQYSDDGSIWYDHETIDLTVPAVALHCETITLSTPGDDHRYWRLLANADTASGCGWIIVYCHIISADTEWVRIFNRFITNASAQIDELSDWIRDRYYHRAVTILSDTTPAYGSPELISASVPAWGVSILCGGIALIAHAVVSNAMLICSGSGRQRGRVRVLEAGSYNDLCWEADTNSSGQISHYGNNTTYTTYEIKKFFDELPSDI